MVDMMGDLVLIEGLILRYSTVEKRRTRIVDCFAGEVDGIKWRVGALKTAGRRGRSLRRAIGERTNDVTIHQ
jgi:hypothetical protein